MYEKLPEEEKVQWTEQAMEEYETAMTKWKDDTEGNPLTAPEDCQKWVPVLCVFYLTVHIDVSRGWFASPNPF